ncbi:hypothetical protein BGZ97_003810 [Linnemannia gamsii]|uniref:Galactose oxidase n=1 Tax=Linnemannia gamsii TaxID=64522 RepID=A0A9P6QWL8_9FUNG|nr:hypothetical protein BGZ97_003810 [Linnemannia gamsii]
MATLAHHTAVSAQEHGYYTPIVTTGAAFARTQTKLYVLSGNAQNVGNSAIPQFISLDLNVNWNTTAPAWTKLADGPMQDIFPAAFTSDEQSMFVFHLKVKGLPWQYHVESDSWYVGGKDSFTDMDMQGVNVVTDPRSSLMYVPEGYDLALLNQKPWNLTTMAIFDPLTSSLNHMILPVPDEVFPVRQYYGNVWSKKRNSILYFGGHNLYVSAPVPKYPNIVTEFSPDTMTFRALASAENAPSMRADHCMAAISNEVFVLDVDSGNWTQGVSANQPRMYPACTVAGNQLIVWGGRTAENVLAPPEILIYDFVLRNWTTRNDPEESKSLATAAASLSMEGGGSSRSRRSNNLVKDPMESNEEYELERTLMDLEEQKRELELKQQQLVLQHRAENPEPMSSEDAGVMAKAQKRGPTAYVEPEVEYIPVPTPGFLDQQQQKQHEALSKGTPGSAGTKFSDKSSGSSSSWTPTTYAVPSSSSSLPAPSYISPSSIVRTMSTDGVQGGLVQIVPEPMYEPNRGFDPMVPDLVYGQQTGSGKEWIRRAQGPQIVVGDPDEEGTVTSPLNLATIPLPSP